MYADDGSRANYLIGFEARQRLATAKSQLSKVEAGHESALKHQNELKSQHTDLSGRCSKLAISLGLVPDTEPIAFSKRYQTLINTAEFDTAYSNSQEELKTYHIQNKAAHAVLSESASNLGLEVKLGPQVQRVLMLEESDRAAWDKWEASEKHLAKLIGKVEQCEIDCSATESKLNQLTASLPFSNYTAEEIRAALPNLRKLEKVYSENQELLARIEAMERAIKSLDNGALRLARVMDISEDKTLADPIQIIDTARACVSASNAADKARNVVMSDLDDIMTKKRKSEQTLLNAEEALSNIFDGQMAKDLKPNDRVAKLAERDHIQKDLKAAVDEKQQARSGIDDALFSEELDLLPHATRASELEQLLTDVQVECDNARDSQLEAERLHSEAFEATDDSSLITEQATLREELRSQAR